MKGYPKERLSDSEWWVYRDCYGEDQLVQRVHPTAGAVLVMGRWTAGEALWRLVIKKTGARNR